MNSTVNQLPNNLPLQLTSFIGRKLELAEVKQLLQTTRLLTLTGVGGCGKTRLALQVIQTIVEGGCPLGGFPLLSVADVEQERATTPFYNHQLALANPQFPDGVWLVELATLADPTLVTQAVAVALGVCEQPGRSLVATLADYLRSRQLLLVLDNCEHLVQACAQLAKALLQARPHLRILATSREALGIPGETTWLVPPLSSPDPQQGLTVEELARYESVRLFVERAQAALPGFALTNQNAADVAQVCRQLDGIPLAIELAAARVQVLSLEQIAARMGESLRLLTANVRTAPSRHQTLRAVVDWSHDLLSEKERVLFRRLSSFARGFTLEAAEQVAAGTFQVERSTSGASLQSSTLKLQPNEILDLLSRLVDKSLVVVERHTRAAHYRLLEPIRQYAAEKLRTTGEEVFLCNCHRDWCLTLAEESARELRGANQVAWLARLDHEYSNIQAALAWSFRTGAVEAGLRLAGAIWWYWDVRGYWSEGRRWLEKMLQKADAVFNLNQTNTTVLSAEALRRAKAQALLAAGAVSWHHEDFPAAQSWLQESIALADQTGDRWCLAYALCRLGRVTAKRGDPTAAYQYFTQSLRIFRELGDTWGISRPLRDLGRMAHAAGDYAAALTYYQEALALRRSMNDKDGIADILNSFGHVLRAQGDYAQAAKLYTESLALFQELGYKMEIASTLNYLGFTTCATGDNTKAEQYFKQGLLLDQETGILGGILLAIIGLGTVALARGDAQRAAQLAGFVEAVRHPSNIVVTLIDRPTYERLLAASASALDDSTFLARKAAGQAMSLEQGIAYALETAAASNAAPQRHKHHSQFLHIFALGPARVYRGDSLLTNADWTYARSRELVFYLLCHPGATREQIALEFWPDASTEQVRSRFSAVLTHTRKALGREIEWITFKDGCYAFNQTGDYWFDIEVFEAKLRTAHKHLRHEPRQLPEAILCLESAVALYQGDFAVDLGEGRWQQRKREQLRQAFEDALLSLGRFHCEAGRYEQAAETYRRALAHDRYLEAAHRELMRCLARLGEPALALRQYGVLVRTLQELDAPPSTETQTLSERLRRGEQI